MPSGFDNLLRVLNTALLLCAVIILLLIWRAMPTSSDGTVRVSSDITAPIYVQTDPTGGHPLQIDTLPALDVNLKSISLDENSAAVPVEIHRP